MSDLRELYQQVIVDHAKSPKNFGKLEGADRSIDGYNPLCGDKIKVYVKLDGDRLEDVRFEGSGCAISMASASLMTQALRGKTVADAEDSIGRFHALVTSPPESLVPESDLGKPAILAGVREFPVRIKCATLAWHSLRAALKGDQAAVTTE